MFRATSNFEIAKSFEQNRVYRFWVSDGGIGGCPGTGVSLIGKREPAQLPNISGDGVAVASMCADLH